MITTNNNEWTNRLSDWGNRFAIALVNPVGWTVIEQVEKDLGPLPKELKSLYRHSNGLSSDWFAVLPIEDETNLKKTWDGIRRANAPEKALAFGGDAELLARFLVFARIGSGNFAAIERATGRIWYQENGELVETSLGLIDFIETCLREVRDL